MTNERKNTIQLLTSVTAVVFGAILVAAGFIVEPTGEIHPSVLTAFGEILTFAGAVIGVDYHYKDKRDGRQTNN